jgi:hypothetical protein
LSATISGVCAPPKPLGGALRFAIAAFALATFLVSCAPTESPTATAEALFDALMRRDRDALLLHFPVLAENPEQLEALLRGTEEVVSWRTIDSEVRGNRATVSMAVTVEGPATGEVFLNVPLTIRRGRWIIDGTIGEIRHIEMIPLE